MKNKLFVTGGGGMVGSYVDTIFSEWETYITDRRGVGDNHKLDCSNYNEFKEHVEQINPDVILHLAANTNVDVAEGNLKETYLSNTQSTIHAAELAAWYGSKLVYISTGGIFQSNDETKLFNEYDTPNPPTIYGKTKQWGEIEVERILPDNSIVARAGWMMGGGLQRDHKFVGFMSKLLMDGSDNVIPCARGVFGSPTYAYDLLNGIKKILDHRENLCGTFHLSNQLESPVSRFEMLVEMNNLLKTNRVFQEVDPIYFDLDAERPPSEAINSIKMPMEGLQQPTWQDALSRYITNEILQGE